MFFIGMNRLNIDTYTFSSNSHIPNSKSTTILQTNPISIKVKNTSCMVCLEKTNSKQTRLYKSLNCMCNSYMHIQCFEKTNLESNKQCPTCKKPTKVLYDPNKDMTKKEVPSASTQDACCISCFCFSIYMLLNAFTI